MAFEIITTSAFQKDAKPLLKKYPSLKADLLALVDSLEDNPNQGTLLRENCYKIRLAIGSKRRGKSGGARVITCLKIVSERVYLICIYDKSDQEALSDKELSARISEID